MSASTTTAHFSLRLLPSLRLWLCAAMLFVQTLALVHGVSHGLLAARQSPGLQVQAQSQQGLLAPDEQSAEACQASDLFAGHQDSFKCRLLDHLADQGTPALLLSPPEPAVRTSVRSDFPVERLASRLIAVFQARGPPTRT